MSNEQQRELPDRIAELEIRVAKLESHVGGLMMIVDRLEEMHGIGRTLMEHGSDGHTHVGQPAQQTESKLDKARRLYYKGVKFKDPLDNRIADSIEEFSMNADGDVWHVGPLGHHYICLDGQWAEIVQDEPADVKPVLSAVASIEEIEEVARQYFEVKYPSMDLTNDEDKCEIDWWDMLQFVRHVLSCHCR